MERFKSTSCEKYIGKWCLQKRITEIEYHKIYVADIKDGVIKIKRDCCDKYEYYDTDYFEDTIFIVSPFQELNLNGEKYITRGQTYPIGYGITSIDSDTNELGSIDIKKDNDNSIWTTYSRSIANNEIASS